MYTLCDASQSEATTPPANALSLTYQIPAHTFKHVFPMIAPLRLHEKISSLRCKLLTPLANLDVMTSQVTMTSFTVAKDCDVGDRSGEIDNARIKCLR